MSAPSPGIVYEWRDIGYTPAPSQMNAFDWAVCALVTGFVIGRVWQRVRDERQSRETLRAVLRTVRVNPTKAEEILASILEPETSEKSSPPSTPT